MITLKVVPYSTGELEILNKILTDNINYFRKACKGGDCTTCNLRHLCIDMQNAQIYITDKLNSRQGK